MSETVYFLDFSRLCLNILLIAAIRLVGDSAFKYAFCQHWLYNFLSEIFFCFDPAEILHFLSGARHDTEVKQSP